MIVEAIGGTGKSALTWEWARTRAPVAIDGYAGALWWSFYEGSASMTRFLRELLAYASRRPLDEVSALDRGELAAAALDALRERPYLIVLDGFERLLSAYHRFDPSKLRDEDVETSQRSLIEPQADEVVRALTGAGPSKLLISTRLLPDALETPTGRLAEGVAQLRLPGLRDADVVDLLRRLDVRGDPHEIATFFRRLGNHPLLIGVVAGLVRDYRPEPGGFHRWLADPTAGGALSLPDLDLKQRRTHILAAGLAGLDAGHRRLLGWMAEHPGAIAWSTLVAVNPFVGDPPAAAEPDLAALGPEPAVGRPEWTDWNAKADELRIAARAAADEAWRSSDAYIRRLSLLIPALTDLGERGLLSWDRASNTYYLHPIVRSYVDDELDDDDRVKVSERIRDHFAALPPDTTPVPAAVLMAIERTVWRATTIPALAVLSRDLEPLSSNDLLPAEERAELDLLLVVSEEVAASREARTAVNRVERLRAARRRLDARGSGSQALARYRPQIARLVDEALREAEAQRRQLEPVPRVYRDGGTPLEPATPDAPTTFKGRGDVFARLEQLLAGPARSTVILHGPRRSGKTSLLKQLPRSLGPSVIPVFVDLQGGLGAAERPATLLAGLAGEITAQARSQRGIDALPALDAATLNDEPYVAFGRWLDELERAIAERHILLCIDEYETLQDQIASGRFDLRILDLLRNMVQHRRHVTVALTGAHTLAELPGAWASRLVSTTAIELGPLERTDAEKLITQPVPGFPDVYTRDAVRQIMAETAREPFLLQVLCAALVDGLNARHWHPGQPRVDAADVIAATGQAVQRAEHYFLNLWEETVPDAARPLVRVLARPARTTVDEIDPQLLHAVLALERHRVLSRTSTGGCALTVPLFARYIQARQSLPASGRATGRDLGAAGGD